LKIDISVGFFRELGDQVQLVVADLISNFQQIRSVVLISLCMNISLPPSTL